MTNNELLTKFTSSFHPSKFIKWLEPFDRFTRVNNLKVLACWLLSPLKYWQNLRFTFASPSLYIRFTFAQGRRCLLSACFLIAFWRLPRQGVAIHVPQFIIDLTIWLTTNHWLNSLHHFTRVNSSNDSSHLIDSLESIFWGSWRIDYWSLWNVDKNFSYANADAGPAVEK